MPLLFSHRSIVVAAIVGGLVVLAGGASAESLPSSYWDLPVPPQGSPPSAWSTAERSFAPENCGLCHVDQFEQWRTSLHAKSFSPGLVGQLLTFDAGGMAACMRCHAPFAEQQQALQAARGAGQAHLPEKQGLAAAGIFCGVCHVRGHRRFGPPQRGTGAVGQSDTEGPHGGVLRSADFEDSNFCATCHQFSQDLAINGKPLENTVVEWRSSAAAREGKTCQSCHMPDRKHLWRGIHDSAMVESGLTADFLANKDKARFRLTNTGVGHAFPTYVTPKAIMQAAALDMDNQIVPSTEVSVVIQRKVEFAGGEWVERADTRLLPGESQTLEISWPPSGRVRLWLEIHPDDFYDHDVFDALLRQLPSDGASAELIAEADRRAQASRFRLFETELDRH